jgi:hypothetical protein
MNIDLGKLLKEKGKTVVVYLLSMLSLGIVAKWDSVVALYDKGAEIERLQGVKDDLKIALQDTAVLNAAFSNPEFVSIFFNNPTVNQKIEELGVELHKNVVTKIINKDSSKVSSRDYLAAAINMHPDSVLPFMGSFFRQVRKGEIATKKDVKSISIETAKAVVSRRRSPGFNDNVN